MGLEIFGDTVTDFGQAGGLMNVAVPTARPVAPARRNSIAIAGELYPAHSDYRYAGIPRHLRPDTMDI